MEEGGSRGYSHAAAWAAALREEDTRNGGQGLFFYRAGCSLDMHATTGSIAFHNASSGSVQPACFFCQNLSDRTASPLPMFAMLGSANADGRDIHGCLACLDVDLWKAHACPSEMVTLRVCDKIPVICLVEHPLHPKP